MTHIFLIKKLILKSLSRYCKWYFTQMNKLTDTIPPKCKFCEHHAHMIKRFFKLIRVVKIHRKYMKLIAPVLNIAGVLILSLNFLNIFTKENWSEVKIGNVQFRNIDDCTR